MLHTCDGVFQSSCYALKSHAMRCDVNSNMLVILLPILEYLSYSLSDFQAELILQIRILDHQKLFRELEV